VRGKPDHIKNWLLFRKLDILGGEDSSSPRVMNYLYFATWFYIVMPFVVLAGWVCLMFFDRFKENKPYWGPFCILVAGLCFLLFGFNTCRVKWTNFRVKMINVLAGLLCMALLTAY
jgi:putative Mn2+ efflux pump MntP